MLSELNSLIVVVLILKVEFVEEKEEEEEVFFRVEIERLMKCTLRIYDGR